VDFYDWMLALHILAAFAIAAALVLYSTMVVAGRRADTLEGTRHIFRLAPAGTPLMAAGMILTLVLGIVLAVDADAFQVWDPWVLAAIVLWALFGEVGRRTGVYYTETQKLAESGGAGAEAEVLARLRAPDGARLHALGLLIFVLLLLDMIFKPGA
jgi:uncharacterized membrane protein